MYKSGADYRPKSLSLNFTRNTFGYTEQYNTPLRAVVPPPPPLPFPPSLYPYIRELPSLWIPAGASALFLIYGMDHLISSSIILGVALAISRDVYIVAFSVA